MSDEPPTKAGNELSGAEAAGQRYRPVPSEVVGEDGVRRIVESWTDAERRTIAMTVRNLEGWGTLPGKVLRFDPTTGDRLEPEIRLSGPYDRNERGLPAGWSDLLIRMGWLDLAWLADGSAVWKPTAVATEAVAAWLPDHLQAAEVPNSPSVEPLHGGSDTGADLLPVAAHLAGAPTDTPSQGELPRPDAATEAAVRRILGTRRPIGADRSAVPVDRLDLLAEALTPEVTALAVLWLGGTRRASAQTRIAYADDLLLWADWARRELGREQFALDLHRAEITMWLTRQQDAGAAESSIARRLSTLSSFYKYANSWGLQVIPPISDDDHRPKVRRGRKATSARVLQADDVTALLAAATDVRDALVVGLLFTGALRVSELCAADDTDRHDEGRRTWLVITRKGGAQVRVPLETTVAELLDLYVAIRPAWTGTGRPALIVDAAGKRLDRHDVTRLLRRLAKAAGIPRPEKVTPHSLRATAITDQKRRGLNAEDIQELSGHADVRTVMIYIDDDGRSERVSAITDDLGRVMRAVPRHLRRAT